jgi:hypothetical protein
VDFKSRLYQPKDWFKHLYLACKGDERSAVFHHAEFDVSKYYVKNKIVGTYEMV